jgi:glycosyltransferase involved in cell wall biosynthesis
LDCGTPVRAVALPQQVALAEFPVIAREFSRFRPDVVLERFYNFAGAGVVLAHRRGVPCLLEVNAPMIDPPGSLKSRLDRMLLGTMRRWAVKQAQWSSCIITPLASTVPPEVPRHKICELPWGANVERFNPELHKLDPDARAALAAEFGLDASVPVAVFLGSFRPWHGVGHFAEAARRMLLDGSDVAFLAVGGGPELEEMRERVRSWKLPPGRFAFTGPQHHERIPALLALADIGVAPFDLAAHAPLSTFGFYWSPLKVFEYMAMGLPVVTVDVAPLNEIVRHEREGLLYPSGDLTALVNRIGKLAADASLREKLGASGRDRVVDRYSWSAHCAALDALLRRASRAA